MLEAEIFEMQYLKEPFIAFEIMQVLTRFLLYSNIFINLYAYYSNVFTLKILLCCMFINSVRKIAKIQLTR